DFRHRQPQFLGQRHQMRRVQAAIAVVDAVQAFEQHVAPPRHVAERLAHRLPRRRFYMAALGTCPFALAALTVKPCRISTRTHGAPRATRYRMTTPQLRGKPMRLYHLLPYAA